VAVFLCALPSRDNLPILQRMSIKIATWNVNSLRIREHMLAKFISIHKPDMLCLQETKVEDSLFPHGIVRSLGFKHVVLSGEKSYNGVAILSKLPIKEIAPIDMIGPAPRA
jgi:exodeoxyribonuclease III